MNKTANGRWNRYRDFKGEKQKKCNGPLHPEEGAWLPLRSFWFVKTGKRAGKPMSQCQECQKVQRGRNPRSSGYVPIKDVWWIFVELRNRLGKVETLRRMGASANFWMRVENGTYTHIRKTTLIKGVQLLAQVRENGEVRHKDSIQRGASARGETERIPTRRKDFYKSHGDNDSDTRRRFRREHGT